MWSGRKFPIGAEVIDGAGVDFRVWAPSSQTAAVELYLAEDSAGSHAPLQNEGNGYFSGTVATARKDARYRIRLDHGAFPDPMSRYQPEGPHGPSQVVDSHFCWNDAAWRGRPPRELVIYELHLGTFTSEGTWRAAAEQLPELARIGITMIEVMPIAEFPGAFGWGYDGVDLFAPTRLYGSPADARAFIDRAHQLKIMVILDVVYNHVGPDGNFLRGFSPDYFSTRYANEWGEPMNFDGDHSGPVREFFITNARYWIHEFHFDGLRLDATQQIFDASSTHILADIAEAVRGEGGDRTLFLVAENETQETRLVRQRGGGGYGLDALWNDDFHHSAKVVATGRAEAYYNGYRGSAQEFISAAKYGFLYQGSWYRWQRRRRGSPAFDLGAPNFVQFLENHDQTANSLRGARLHQLTSASRNRALTALLLLSPQIPLLFQGQEFGASAPFLYFADHQIELRKQVAKGRRKFLEQFPSVASPEAAPVLADPGEKQTFLRCKLDLREREANHALYRLHEDLLRLRREDLAVRAPVHLDGAVLGDRAFVLRYFAQDGADRILVVNLGIDLWVDPAPEPLLAPIERHGWRILWSSESPNYGGTGTAALETTANWIIPGETAVLLCPDENRELAAGPVSQKD
jgi:maltooligosyltrehalose trehalohydrolase